jgi:hypothetical protein
MFNVPNDQRVREGFLGSNDSIGNNGAFIFNLGVSKLFRVVASDGEGWEHVSVSYPNRCPTWNEMCMIKDIFWDEDDCVIQYHPPKEDYIDNHKFCLHLWRPIGVEIPRPPKIMVGI